MFKKNLVLKIVIIAIVLLFCYKGILPIYSAKTKEKNWKSIGTDQVATYVVNEYKRQVNKKPFNAIVLLDSNGASVLGATNLSLTITKNRIWEFVYNLWTINYNNYSLPIVNRMYMPPYIIYKDTVYYNTKGFSSQLSFAYQPLK